MKHFIYITSQEQYCWIAKEISWKTANEWHWHVISEDDKGDYLYLNFTETTDMSQPQPRHRVCGATILIWRWEMGRGLLREGTPNYPHPGLNCCLFQYKWSRIQWWNCFLSVKALFPWFSSSKMLRSDNLGLSSVRTNFKPNLGITSKQKMPTENQTYTD